MLTFQDLQEGVYDPNILKAFFLAGGPGSGKSYVVKRTTGGLGMKVINSDIAFEKKLKDAKSLIKKSNNRTESGTMTEPGQFLTEDDLNLKEKEHKELRKSSPPMAA